jgi:hypothetical protein
MFTSRFTNVSVLALTMSVCVCLLATADVQALAQKSAAVVAAQSQARKVLKPAVGLHVSAQVERPAEEVTAEQSSILSGDEKRIAHAPLLRETFCALLSKYLSLS